MLINKPTKYCMLLPVWQTPGPRLWGSILLAPGPFLLSHSLKRLFLDFEQQKPKILKVYKKSRHQNNALSLSLPAPHPGHFILLLSFSRFFALNYCPFSHFSLLSLVACQLPESENASKCPETEESFLRYSKQRWDTSRSFLLSVVISQLEPKIPLFKEKKFWFDLEVQRKVVRSNIQYSCRKKTVLSCRVLWRNAIIW